LQVLSLKQPGTAHPVLRSSNAVQVHSAMGITKQFGENNGATRTNGKINQPAVLVPLPPCKAAPVRFRRHQPALKQHSGAVKAHKDSAPALVCKELEAVGDGQEYLAGAAALSLLKMMKAKGSATAFAVELVPAATPANDPSKHGAILKSSPSRGRRRLPTAALKAANRAANQVPTDVVATPRHPTCKSDLSTRDAQNNRTQVSADPVMYEPEFVPRKPLQSLVAARRAVASASAARGIVEFAWPSRPKN